MDSAIEKINAYDFFCVFLSGVIFSTICLCTGSPNRYVFWQGRHDTIALITFLAMSCLWGLIFQGTGSFIDKHAKVFRLGLQTRYNFLEQGRWKIFEIELERKQFQKFVDEMSKENWNEEAEKEYIAQCRNKCKEKCRQYCKSKRSGACKESCKGKNKIECQAKLKIKQDKCYLVYKRCENYLRVHGKNEQIEKISLMYGLSRSLAVSGVFLLFIHIAKLPCKIEGVNTNWIMELIFFVFMTVSFCIRTNQYGKLRVRTVLREYIQIAQIKDTTTDKK